MSGTSLCYDPSGLTTNHFFSRRFEVGHRTEKGEGPVQFREA